MAYEALNRPDQLNPSQEPEILSDVGKDVKKKVERPSSYYLLFCLIFLLLRFSLLILFFRHFSLILYYNSFYSSHHIYSSLLCPVALSLLHYFSSTSSLTLPCSDIRACQSIMQISRINKIKNGELREGRLLGGALPTVPHEFSILRVESRNSSTGIRRSWGSAARSPRPCRRPAASSTSVAATLVLENLTAPS